MSHPLTIRRTLACVLFGSITAFALQAGCGDTTGATYTFPEEEFDGSTGPTPPGFENGDGSSGNIGNPDATGILDVTPATATINVTIVNGVVTAPKQTFTASYNGQPVTGVTWLFDRGELGDISKAGVFTASGTNVGEGVVTARYGAREGTATVKIVVNSTQNGAPTGADAGGGSGGIGGVGGEPLGADVAANIVTRLKTQSNPPASAAELGFLYPYDKTVWPRGLLPPLLMWQSTREASAVYVKLSQGNYTFEGTYSLAQFPAGSDARRRVRLEESAWKTATQGNTGDDLKLEVKIYSSADDKVYGPISRTWKVAPGVLKGTVYYNSYDSSLTAGGGAEMGGVIKIRPRSPDPELALPNMAGKCHVCHSVSADGSTLWVQDATGPVGTETEYANGASWNLKNASKVADYKAVGAGGNIANDHKFTWSAPYPDGSFALASAYYAREAYTRGDSKLFKRSDGNELATSGFTNTVKSAVTPAFAPDGRKVVFNFWEGPGGGGVTAGAGRSLAVMDFSCGAAAGSITCAPNATNQFSNLREIYRDNARWPAWPTFLPDNSAVVFHNTKHGGECAPAAPNNTKDGSNEYIPYKPSTRNCQLTTWYGATSELWVASAGATKSARRLDAANGNGLDLPTNADHPNDTLFNYQPTVNPVASGGYFWVVFTSRRIYGNLLTGKPWGDNNGDGGGPQKKLWVAAIDINNPNAGADPSHPAFYLPGQELDAGNSRGFWVVDPCKANGNSCETGDECCNGFCRKDDKSGGLVCMDKPPGAQCVQEFEKCTVDADCCDPKYECIANKCTRPDPNVK
ncbi:MAG: hypothetical protein BGO98_22000 [Myxococcales bacterium 68-20]|nr:MAG: hypothetical protein BGO98_22000 [Myxococcales bacterium 68-20]